MKIMFLDESGDHSLVKIDEQFPVFCLAGCIFDEGEYQQNSKAKTDAFKNPLFQYFGCCIAFAGHQEVRAAF